MSLGYDDTGYEIYDAEKIKKKKIHYETITF